ncbi:hypothetical protein U9M73_04005 [Paenibacillus phoenicis]|uniref:Uncharacterized protein n=1 Tax=Paenibacillus phoenicis TaxID=554117 RepID=A0ABU5PGT8_9BACL|nr:MULTISPECIES: hypothetical protein [Paenibacillus]EES74944.1 hypothetical protein POTG_00175 [Paenibacillus sp. oral taxon 786 str. D14]MEA3569156.1 hypothetical protein [Paenibacillus phoenicis]
MLYAFLVGVGFCLVPFPAMDFFLLRPIFGFIRALGMIVTIFAGLLLLTECYTHLKSYYGNLIPNLAITAAVILALLLIFYWGLF